MVLRRLYPAVFGSFSLAIAPCAAHADVFELTSGGNFVEISKPAWQPEPVVTDDIYVSQPIQLPVATAPGMSLPQSDVRQHIQVAAARYGINSALVDAVAWQESRYNPRARSSAGAIGVMQLMPGTARQLGVSNPHDVRQNVAGGAAYLRQQLERFGNNVPLALAAYNAGPGAVMKYGGIPPYRETQDYVRQIMRRMSAPMAYRSGY
jgi:soluble lytic murein transglycosylase-like protein